jgi:hypothetical protein
MIDELLSGDPAAIGRYRLLGRLGLGDMGQVFLGQSSGGMLVAVKVIRPELADDPGFRSRFAREVTAARNVGGLFTARVVDADPDAPAPWVATAYVAGPSLAEAVERHGALPAASVVRLAAGLAEGLAAIHAAGVVHRNLKPTNVLLSCDGPRVVDFGISQAVDTTMLAKTGMVMGSPGFMSPEAVNAEEAGPPSDIFSLGGVLAFAATGEGPFGTGPSPALVYRVLTKEPYLSRVPPELRGMVRRCLSKDPAGRPTAEDLLAGLGGGRLAPDWLPEPVAAMLTRYTGPAQDGNQAAPGTRTPAAAGDTTAPAGVSAGRPGGLRRWWMAVAAAVLLAAAGSTAFALNTPGPGHPVTEPLTEVTTRAGANTPSQSSATASASTSTRATAKQATQSPRSSDPAPTPAPAPTPTVAAQPNQTQPASPARPAQPTRPATGVVPNVQGENQSGAEAALKAAGLDNYSGLYGCYGSQNVDDVVTQTPAAGTRIALTAAVHLELQAGNCVTIPDVVGLRLTKAESTLYALGFAPADVTSLFACDSGYTTNQVVSQSPAAGTSYVNDKPVSLGIEADNCG